MSRIETRLALILSDDARDPFVLGPIIEASGCIAYGAVPMTADVEDALRTTPASLVLVHVDLKRDTLARPEDVAVLGLLLRDPSYGQRHAVVLVTRTPDVVRHVLGPILARLHVPVLELPCVPEVARATLASACARIEQQETVVVAASAPTA